MLRKRVGIIYKNRRITQQGKKGRERLTWERLWEWMWQRQTPWVELYFPQHAWENRQVWKRLSVATGADSNLMSHYVKLVLSMRGVREDEYKESGKGRKNTRGNDPLRDLQHGGWCWWDTAAEDVCVNSILRDTHIDLLRLCMLSVWTNELSNPHGSTDLIFIINDSVFQIVWFRVGARNWLHLTDVSE